MSLSKRTANKAKAGEAPRVGPEAWVRAGLSALVAGGIGAVNVERQSSPGRL